MVSMASRRRRSASTVFSHQRLLLGNVDRNADQMRLGFAGLLDEFAARAQPHPVAIGVPHAEGMVDEAGLGVGKLGGKIVELQIVGMNQGIDLAEAEQVSARLQPQDREHGMRPEDAAAGEVPVPQSAASAVERGIDAGVHRFVDLVGFARARRLPMEGEAKDQHHEAGRRGERDGQRGIGAPGRERVVARMDDGELAAVEVANGGERRASRRRAGFQGRRRVRRRWSAAARGREHRADRRPMIPRFQRHGSDQAPSALMTATC